MIQSATAPDRIRMKVNVAASIVVCLSASRQSKELLANAIIAIDVSMKSRVDFIAHEIRPNRSEAKWNYRRLTAH